MKMKAKTFIDSQGNRFVFPGYVYEVDSPDIPFATEFWSIGLMMKAATGIEMEDGWYEFEDSHFPHIKVDITSSGFAHGGASAWAFAGPLFEQTLKEIENVKNLV